MNKLVLYIQESYDELRNHVTWPTWQELLSTAGLVIATSSVIAAIIFGMDATINAVLRLLVYS